MVNDTKLGFISREYAAAARQCLRFSRCSEKWLSSVGVDVSAAQGLVGMSEDRLPGISRTELQSHPAYAEALRWMVAPILNSLRRMVSTPPWPTGWLWEPGGARLPPGCRPGRRSRNTSGTDGRVRREVLEGSAFGGGLLLEGILGGSSMFRRNRIHSHIRSGPRGSCRTRIPTPTLSPTLP